MLVMKPTVVVSYLPLLLAAAVVSGLITGGAAAGVLKASRAAGFLKKERDA